VTTANAERWIPAPPPRPIAHVQNLRREPWWFVLELSDSSETWILADRKASLPHMRLAPDAPESLDHDQANQEANDMANEANQEPDKAPWTVKSVPVETRKLAVSCATKTGETMAEWLARAVRNQANLETGERVIPPKPEKVVAPAIAREDMAALVSLMTAVQSMAAAPSDQIPSSVVRQAVGMLRDQLRLARGKTLRQTSTKNWQTINAGLLNGEAHRSLPSPVNQEDATP